MPADGTNFGYQTSYYASSEPTPELNGSKSKHSAKGKGYPYERIDRGFEEYQRQLERYRKKLEKCQLEKREAKGLAESRGIQLFHSLRKAKDSSKAEKLYKDIVKDTDPARSEEEVILELKYSFAALLIEQKRVEEAEPISKEVWEKTKHCQGPRQEFARESHRQVCSVLCAVGKIRDAENMHRSMYQKETRDSWALENGDEVCQRLKEQGDIKRAKEMQDEVWKERQKQNGPRHELTIRSGLRLNGFLEELVATSENQGGTDAERRLNISHKQAFECEIEVILRKIWDIRLYPEPSTDILHAGHKLGVILFHQTKFSDAEAIFMPVWESKKRYLGDSNVSTTSTASMLGKAFCRQDKPETYRSAVDVLQGQWQVWIKNEDAEAISSGEDLAQAYFSLRDWPSAEVAYRWIAIQKTNKRVYPRREIDEAHWKLGQTLHKQGLGKSREAEKILGGLYQHWNASPPNLDQTVQCGQMLAQALLAQKKSKEALKVAREVFSKVCGLVERNIAYLNSACLYGSLLLEDDQSEEAERILKSVWEDQVEGTEEKKVRLKCGHLYGQALFKRIKYPEAKRILEAVAEAQGAVSPEIQEIRQLLEDVNRLIKKRNLQRRSRQRSGFLMS